jgi:N-acetylglucosaminyldiphosphoundecaprenol N-acetyl-beta-D-mannosaminyltransferase
MDRTDFIGVGFHAQSLERALADLVTQADLKAAFVYAANPNVDVMVRLHRDPVLAHLWTKAWRTWNDSRILELLAGFSGLKLPPVPGSDLTAALFDRVISPEEPLTIIGGDDGLADLMRAKYGLSSLHLHQPPMGLRNRPEAVAEAAAFAAAHPSRFVLLAIGAPQQEMVARAIQDRGDVTGVGICIGASLDFLVGRQTRAPKWVSRLRLEWLFRLMSEPKRLWRRYLVEGPRIFALWWAWRAAR